MQETDIEIINKAGLHARASSKLAELAASFASDIKVGHEKMVDGKSILSLMMLAATKGTMLKITTDGEDEEDAMSAIVALINDRFHEGE